MDQKKKKKNKKILKRSHWFLWTILIGGGLALGYFWILYTELLLSFNEAQELIPTRLYSDVVPITLGQPRFYIYKRLKTLSYSLLESPTAMEYTPHSIDFPHSLIPENHPQLLLFVPEQESLGVAEAPAHLVLGFDPPGPLGTLKSITYKNQSLSDFYLEPELIATLSQQAEDKRIRAPLTFDEVPSSVWKAIIAVEDQHFLEHSGLDPRGLARALWVNLKTCSLAQGGSTLTQQLVKNLMIRRSKNIFRKISEMVLSFALEIKFSKKQILERYLNEVYLGQVGNLEVHGVSQGAEHFFGKKLTDLNLAETALMVGLIRGPSYYSPYRYPKRATARQRLVLKKMLETGQMAEEEFKIALKLPIQLASPKNSSTQAPFFTDTIKNKFEIPQTGLKVYTTLDSLLNTFAQEAITNGVSQIEKNLKRKKIKPFKKPSSLPSPEAPSLLEGALVCMDHQTGSIKALVGGKNYAKSNFNRVIHMKRQVGSTFKPIVSLSAFEKGSNPEGVPYTPAYPLQTSEWSLLYDNGKQRWNPKNNQKITFPWVSLRYALTHSINTAIARLGIEVGIKEVIQTARDLGVSAALPELPSLLLGIAELSPMELLSVYATLASGGIQTEPVFIRAITPIDSNREKQEKTQMLFFTPATPIQKHVQIHPASIDLLTDILQGVFTEGTAQSSQKMGWTRPSAGKTGTTNEHRDAWFAGYTPELTTVVWVGKDQSQVGQLDLTGANSALPIWVSFMKKALASFPPKPFSPRETLTQVWIDRRTGKKASRDCPKSEMILEKMKSQN